MDELGFLQDLTPGKLLLAVVSFITANVIAHFLKDQLSEYLRKERVVNKSFEDNLDPLLHNTQVLIKRLVDSLFGLDPKSNEAARKYLEGQVVVSDDLAQVVAGSKSLDRLEYSAFCLINLLVSIREFKFCTINAQKFRTFEEIVIFLDRKIPMSLRGNVFQKSGMYDPPLDCGGPRTHFRAVLFGGFHVSSRDRP